LQILVGLKISGRIDTSIFQRCVFTNNRGIKGLMNKNYNYDYGNDESHEGEEIELIIKLIGFVFLMFIAGIALGAWLAVSL